MEDLHVFETLTIQSYKGAYKVFFDEKNLKAIDSLSKDSTHIILDTKVADLYRSELKSVLKLPNTILIEAIEKNKGIENIIPVIEKLIENKVRRDHTLFAIGGGIIQDITCFIASTLLRGLKWKFMPTTLLSQADSCIGSKSSINLRNTKNILGTFNPPTEIFINSFFLDTLDRKEILSGIGEILKVHAIQDKEAFDQLSNDYDILLTDKTVLLNYIRKALSIKQEYIEVDEFDRNIRNVFNYGHSFGHAIETATNFIVPHGIAVTFGMDIANRVAVMRNLLPEEHYFRMHSVLSKNYGDFTNTYIPIDKMLEALMKDKKNTTSSLNLILPSGESAKVKRIAIPPNDLFRKQCKQAVEEIMS